MQRLEARGREATARARAESTPQRPNVGWPAVARLANHFRRHPVRCAAERSTLLGGRHEALLQELRGSEVGELTHAVGVHENVGAFDIAVQDAASRAGVQEVLRTES